MPFAPKKPSLLRWALLLGVVVPVASWALVRPVRVIAPTLAGVSCPTAYVCVDDMAQLTQATALYQEANAFVTSHLQALQGEPRVIFCATQGCAESFGLGDRSAVTLGTIGTVIGPRAWKPYYVRHELIHQLQGQQLGVVQLLFKPTWFVEGMAYALSQDPRPVLAEPWQAFRSQFSTWYAQLQPTQLWESASRL